MTPRWLALGEAPGRGIVITSWVTFVVVAVAVAPLALGAGSLETMVIIVCLASFFAGFLLWIVAFFAAIARTARGDDIAVASWVFLSGSAPVAVRNNFMAATGLTLVLSIVTTGVSPFIWLTNLLPLAYAAWWGARHGTFPARATGAGGVARGRPGK
ncbi:MAG TPA: hypothetical protein VGO03_01625 [Acidimicrobiia bacterium]